MASEIPKTPPSPIPAAAAGTGAAAGKSSASSPIDAVFHRVVRAPTDEAARRDLDALARTLTQDHLIEYTDRLSAQELELFLEVTHRLEETHPVSPKTLEAVVQGIAQGIRSLYIDETKASKMASAIDEAYKSHKYDGYKSPLALQRAILEDLRKACGDPYDPHIDIWYSIKPDDTDHLFSKLEFPSPGVLQKIDETAECIAHHSEGNWGITEVKVTEGNVGYIRIDKFPKAHYEGLKKAIDAAFHTVKNTKALIIDLRANTGGDPKAVALVANYLFDKPFDLCTYYDRYSDEVQATVLSPVEVDPHDPKKNGFGGEKPVFCLTSEETFSAGEELAYDLQAMERATIIGEKKTKGGANPARPLVIEGTGFTVQIPNVEAINPYTGTNWEGVGVRPDIVTSYDKALSEAEEIAKRFPNAKKT